MCNGPPGLESIPELLKRFTNTGSGFSPWGGTLYVSYAWIERNVQGCNSPAPCTVFIISCWPVQHIGLEPQSTFYILWLQPPNIEIPAYCKWIIDTDLLKSESICGNFCVMAALRISSHGLWRNVLTRRWVFGSGLHIKKDSTFFSPKRWNRFFQI